MDDRTLVRTGVIGGLIAAVCCATPILVIALAAAGLSAWAAKADYVLIPVILLCIGLVAVGLYRRRTAGKLTKGQGTT